MRLVSLTVRNFRGFGGSAAPVPLDADLLLLFGPNGYGKTSLAEAIEWLLYGTTRRRQRGDGYSKNEFEGCFPNVHGGSPIDVSAKIRTTGGKEHTIARVIPNPRDDLVSVTYIDGTVASLASLGLVKIEGLHPVVAQHDLQSFIHSRPKERRDLISLALGLDEIAALKTALDGARRSFQVTLPAGVEAARKKLVGVAPTLAAVPETSVVGQRWLKQPIEVKAEDDKNSLIKAAQRIGASASEDVEGLLAQLRSKRQQRSSTVFDTTKLMPPAALTAGLTRLTTEDASVTTACTGLAEQLAKAIPAEALTTGAGGRRTRASSDHSFKHPLFRRAG